MFSHILKTIFDLSSSADLFDKRYPSSSNQDREPKILQGHQVTKFILLLPPYNILILLICLLPVSISFFTSIPVSISVSFSSFSLFSLFSSFSSFSSFFYSSSFPFLSPSPSQIQPILLLLLILLFISFSGLTPPSPSTLLLLLFRSLPSSFSSFSSFSSASCPSLCPSQV